MNYLRMRGMVRGALGGAGLFSAAVLFSGFDLEPPLLVLVMALGGALAAVLTVSATGTRLAIGLGPLLGVLTASCGALLQTLASLILVGDGHNPVGEKLAVLWKWALNEYGWTLPGGFSLILRANLSWLRQGELSVSLLSCIAVYSFFASVLPASVGAAVGAVVFGGGKADRQSERNPYYGRGNQDVEPK
jgi:hypothetical protein